MRALVFETFGGPLTVQQVPDPVAMEGGVVVRICRTGVCRSDWHAWQGHDPDIVLPHVPGHELAGEVVEVGQGVRQLNVGDRVTVPFVAGCGECPTCQRGEPQVCDVQFQPGFTHWGSFAEYVHLRHADLNVVRLPPEVSFDVAASLGCRFTTAYRAVVQLAQLAAGETLAVFGMGGVGLSALLVAKALGARVIAVDIEPSKLALARKMGAEICIDASCADPVAQIMDATQGGVNVALDALGSEQTLRQSVLSLRKRGRHLQVGLLIGSRAEPRVPMDRVVGWELVLLGSHGIAASSFPDVFDLIERKQIPIESIVTPAIPLEGVPAVMAQMGNYGGLGLTLVDPELVRA